MPSGYTAKLLEEGQTFEEFVWTCVRGMGAFIMMRDCALDTPIIKKFEYETYYRDALAKAKTDFHVLKNMTKHEQYLYGIKRKRELAENLARDLRREKEMSIGIARYKDMLKKVQEWTPPTSEHNNFKKFMIAQLEESMKFDDHSDYYAELYKRVDNTTHDQHYQEALDRCCSDLEFYTKRYHEDIANVDERNAWIAALYDAVPIPSTMAD